jgi:hypothetical protein
MKRFGIFEKCACCGKLVKVNKFLFGSLHVCLTDEECAKKINDIKQPRAGDE